jgi:two-component system, NtrC family, sensor kinase
MSRILVITGADQGKEFSLDDVLVSIGRDPRNTIVLTDEEVSRNHAYIKKIDNGFVISDRQSSNGTYVNDVRVEKAKLAPQDVIRVGQSCLLFDHRPVESMIDVNKQVVIRNRGGDDSSTGSQILQTVKARMAMPVYDDDSQITDSFIDQLEENVHVIYHTAVATSRIIDINELHQKVLELVFEWTKADRGCVILVDEHKSARPAAFRQRASLGISEPVQVSEDILKRAAENLEGIITSDTVTEARKRRGGTELRPGSVFQTMCAPMQGRMGVVGFLYVESVVHTSERSAASPTMVKGIRKGEKSRGTFTNSFTLPHLKMLLAIAHQAALATENAIYYSAMTRNAHMAAVGETFTQIAHHIRNMLQGIDVAKRRMNQGIDRKNWDLLLEGWREIEPLTSRIYELSLNLLSISRPREPRLQLESINDCVGDVISTVESRFQSKGIKLDWEPNLTLKPFMFDAESIYRAVLNVVQNALDACQLGCVVKIRATEQDGKVSITVVDSGEGIDPRKIDLIFQPFATSRGELGTGVGLPVTRKIMREHGGEVKVSSTLGHGSSFTLILPARRTRKVGEAAHDAGPDTSQRLRLGRDR